MLIRLSLILSVIIIATTSCRLPTHMGFYHPITLDLTVPDGPPEYKAGWHGGCRTALGSIKYFANSQVYADDEGTNYGSGVYQHDNVFQAAWGHGFFACNIHAAHFTNYNSLKNMPLE